MHQFSDLPVIKRRIDLCCLTLAEDSLHALHDGNPHHRRETKERDGREVFVHPAVKGPPLAVHHFIRTGLAEFTSS
jgi:hypothetical protein